MGVQLDIDIFVGSWSIPLPLGGFHYPQILEVKSSWFIQKKICRLFSHLQLGWTNFRFMGWTTMEPLNMSCFWWYRHLMKTIHTVFDGTGGLQTTFENTRSMFDIWGFMSPFSGCTLSNLMMCWCHIVCPTFAGCEHWWCCLLALKVQALGLEIHSILWWCYFCVHLMHVCLKLRIVCNDII